MATGFRPCKRCHPNGLSVEAENVAIVARACRLIEQSEEEPSLTDLAAADLYRRQERWKDARVRLERARRVDPDAEGPRLALNALLAALPEQRGHRAVRGHPDHDTLSASFWLWSRSRSASISSSRSPSSTAGSRCSVRLIR